MITFWKVSENIHFLYWTLLRKLIMLHNSWVMQSLMLHMMSYRVELYDWPTMANSFIAKMGVMATIIECSEFVLEIDKLHEQISMSYPLIKITHFRCGSIQSCPMLIQMIKFSDLNRH
jgi:hypothetical protein